MAPEPAGTATSRIASRPPTLARTWLESRSKLLVSLGIGATAWLAVHAVRDGASGETREASLAEVAARHGLSVAPDAIVWLDDHASWGVTTALFLANEGEGGSRDVYQASVRLGRGGAILDLSDLANLTRSAGADEERLTRLGEAVAFATRARDGVEAFTLLDVRGEPAGLTSSWTRVQRAQNAISNWQETGRFDGYGVTRFQLREPAQHVDFESSNGTVTAHVDGAAVVVDAEGALVEGEARVDVHEQDKGVPGGITWVVDTVRNLSFVGPAPIEWLENRVFAAKDWVDRTRYAWFGDASHGEAAAELGTSSEPTTLTAEQRQLLDAAAVELGFPPAPMTPILSSPSEGEGVWRPIVDDPFVNAYPNAPPAFAQSFIRPDPARPYVTIYVTLWDPRQVQLRIMPGTREPESATGQRGTGYIPRDPMTTRMLVGAFDGGFQAMHGEFGMMSDDRVYLPPKPWAATVAVFDDGRVGMGSWPAPDWPQRYYDENLANRQIPAAMVDMRQNLTSVVESGVYNPWERWWWGAAPPGATEQTYTHRSGLCVTEEGFLAFFWGGSLGPDALGQAMLAARCARSMHLDMNSGHCGMEFYRPYAETSDARDSALPAVARVDSETEFDGRFEGADGYRIRARKAVRSMQMRFPRYVEHDPRDFFYLTLRPVLPGPALAGGEALSTDGLPNAGWPYAFARARHGDTWVVRIDPTRAVPAPLAGEDIGPRVLGHLASSEGELALVATALPVGRQWSIASGAAGGAILRGPRATAASAAAIGVDRDGFLVYAEGPAALAALAAAGVDTAIGLPDAALAFETPEGSAGPDGLARAPAAGSIALLADERARAEVLFPDNAPMPYSRWGYMQGQRVRYFPSQPPRFQRPNE